MEYSELTGKGYEKVSDLYDSSIRVIKENQAPTGAYIAGPTFSQYRYCWFRDGAYIAYAMDLVGEHGSAGRFYDWAARAVVSRARHVERAIVTAKRGDRPSAENLLHTRYTPGGEVGSA